MVLLPTGFFFDMQMITTKEELIQLVKESPALAIYFFNDNCAPCISLRPKVAELIQEKFPNINLIYIDSLAFPEIPASFNVFSNPALLVFFEGKEYIRKSKYMSIPELHSEIERIYKMVF